MATWYNTNKPRGISIRPSNEDWLSRGVNYVIVAVLFVVIVFVGSLFATLISN